MGRPRHDIERAIYLMKQLLDAGDAGSERSAATIAIERMGLPPERFETLRHRYAEARKGGNLPEAEPLTSDEQRIIDDAFQAREMNHRIAIAALADLEERARKLGIDPKSNLGVLSDHLQKKMLELEEYGLEEYGFRRSFEALRQMVLRQFATPEEAKQFISDKRAELANVQQCLEMVQLLRKWKAAAEATRFPPTMGQNADESG